MFLNFLKVLVVGVALLLMVNKFYGSTFCGEYSGKAEKHSDTLISEMSQCADMKVCRIGSISDNTLGGIQVKSWKCVPVLGGGE